MFEIEEMEQEFDYSLVDNDTADFLRSCEYEMNGIAEDARVRFGGVLIKAQDKLAKGGYGVFLEWVKSGGISKDDAYYYIELNRLSLNLERPKVDNFLNAPKSLQKETMKKNAPKDLKERVYSGDITTNKQYQEEIKARKEAERCAKQAESQAETERKERERLEQENEELANVEPERIEVVPDDYDYYKGNYESAISLQNRYKEQMEEMRRELNSSIDKSVDGSEYEKLKQKEEELRNKINSYDKIYDMQSNLEVVLSTVQPKIHSLNADNIKNEYEIIGEFESTIDEVINVCNEIKKRLPNKNIIEGEIVND